MSNARAASSAAYPRALTIAGSDSGGGAGIQADLKTFHACGVYGASVLTALTAQNTLGVHGILDIPTDFIVAQLDAVLDDIGCDAAKTGMLSRPETIAVVADAIRRHAVDRLVVDPVMVAKGGARLLQEAALDALRRELLPRALLVTPNTHEAAILAGRPVETLAHMEDAARAIRDLGPRNVLVKGGHAEMQRPVVVDVLLTTTGELLRFESPRFAARHTHGTGCTLSAAIAAHLARGATLDDAVERGTSFVRHAIQAARELGNGIGPVNHLWNQNPRPA